MACLVLAALSDVAVRSIPNWLSGVVAAAGLLARATQGWAAIEWTALCAVALFVILLVIYARGGLGGGDVKLLTAVALGLAPWDTYQFIWYTAVSGGVLAAAYLVMRKLPPVRRLQSRSNLLKRVYAAERWRIRRRGPLPYGVAIAVGGVLTLAQVIGR